MPARLPCAIIGGRWRGRAAASGFVTHGADGGDLADLDGAARAPRVVVVVVMAMPGPRPVRLVVVGVAGAAVRRGVGASERLAPVFGLAQVYTRADDPQQQEKADYGADDNAGDGATAKVGAALVRVVTHHRRHDLAGGEDPSQAGGGGSRGRERTKRREREGGRHCEPRPGDSAAGAPAIEAKTPDGLTWLDLGVPKA